MHTLLTMTLALVGGGLFVQGWRRFVARRRRERRGARGLRRWTQWALMGAGSVLLLIPDVLANVVVPVGETSTGAAAFWFMVGLTYRLVVIALLAVAMLGLSLLSDRVLEPLQVWRLRWSRDPDLQQARALRRTPVGRALPKDQATLVSYEIALSERIMRYQRDPEAAYSRPALADLADERTAKAIQAMFHAESLRPTEPLYVRHDLLATDYGKAVAALAAAVTEAEAHAERAVASALSDEERAALDEAARMVDFMRQHATSAGERAAAYERVLASLSAAQSARLRDDDASSDQVRAHPWLEVEERAELHRST